MFFLELKLLAKPSLSHRIQIFTYPPIKSPRPCGLNNCMTRSCHCFRQNIPRQHYFPATPLEMAKRSRSTSIDPPSECRSRSSSPDYISSTPAPSKIHLSNTPSDLPAEEAMRCSLPPHRETLSFPSYEDYEVHYHKAHVNRCTECGRNFPTDLFLNLHIEENHDSLIAARRARGDKTVFIPRAPFSDVLLTTNEVRMLRRKLRAKMFYPPKTPNASY